MTVCPSCAHENPDGNKFCAECGAPLALSAERREQRKIVTAVFCDVVGSTALGESRDPEAVRAILARYFKRMRSIVEAHGGTVQKFIGDAVVAIFGVPVVHEDDALRALRAAVEMRDALPGVEVEARIGVNTGEVVTSADDTLVTGDAINVAARLQQAASPGEVLVGADTLGFVGSAARVEGLEPLELKGKAEPVAAFRLVSVGEAPERPHASRFVGREGELALLRAAWGRAAAECRCELVTIVGEPGVGKSRLVAELLASLGVPAAVGRCLSYGEGITYFPVVEVVKQLDRAPDDPAVAAAIGSLLGESDAATTPDEIAWALRKLLEQAAPLVVVFDDIQWGEETFLDLVEQVALLASTPLLLLCLARPELSERRPGWPVALRLDPLPASAVEELLPPAVPAGLRERIARAAGGNPLFLTEMVAMAAEAGEEVVVPPTLKALLAARLDRLEAEERGVLERGSVEGELFHRGAVQALEPAGGQAAPCLMALVRKELIRPERPLLPAEDGFRFCHLLIRDAAYDALPKKTRADLHERFAGWLDQHGTDLVERDELVGYHLEQAHRYRTELGHSDDATRALGQRAAARLVAAGRRATTRGDHYAAASFLRRALTLGIADPRDRVRIQVELGHSLYETRRIADGQAVLDQAHYDAFTLDEPGIAALALVYRHSNAGDPNADTQQVEAICRQAIETFSELGDERGLALAGRLLGLILTRDGRRAEGRAEMEHALEHADASGDQAVRRHAIGTLANQLALGPVPVVEGIERCEALLLTTQSDRVLAAVIKRHLGYLYAMAARGDEALELSRESSLVLDELDQLTFSIFRSNAARARALAGDRIGAEQEYLARLSFFNASGRGSVDHRAIETAYELADFYCDDGRWDDAERSAAPYRDVPLTASNVRGAAMSRLGVEARLAALDGRHNEAIALAERALTLAEPGDHLSPRLWLALAEVQRAGGHAAEADAATAHALELYDQKGNVAAAARVRASAGQST